MVSDVVRLSLARKGRRDRTLVRMTGFPGVRTRVGKRSAAARRQAGTRASAARSRIRGWPGCGHEAYPAQAGERGEDDPTRQHCHGGVGRAPCACKPPQPRVAAVPPAFPSGASPDGKTEVMFPTGSGRQHPGLEGHPRGVEKPPESIPKPPSDRPTE